MFRYLCLIWRIFSQVGFNAGDGITSSSVPGSRTADIVDIETTSNVNVPGKWVFRTDNSHIEAAGCSEDTARK